jgi:hypothetical protein
MTAAKVDNDHWGRATEPSMTYASKFGQVFHLCDNCGARVRVPDGRRVRTLKTGGTAAPTAYVLRAWNKNIHRCALRPSQGSEHTRCER